ncbi:MAG: LysM peptidoglycan-binding domain-containing protein, partial [Pseudomonadales bacterium]
VRQIARWNQIGEKTPLQVGQRIKLYPKKKEATMDLARLPDRPSVERTITYSVKRGDSFGRIASRFQVSIADLKAWNPDLANAKYLQPGDRVRVRIEVQNLVR